MQTVLEHRSPGRPSCEETRNAILRAAYELLEEGGLIIEAAQIEDELTALDTPDNGNGKAPECCRKRLKQTACAFLFERPDRDARAWQRFHRQRSGADLA